MPQIDIAVRAGQWPPEEALAALVERAFAAAARTGNLAFDPEAELSLLFTDDAEMRTINRQWREQDKPTNVLSFPGEDVAEGEPAGAVLGDIVLAFETVKREADLDGKRFDDHLCHLIVHGIFHLFGYDHLDDTQAARMEDMERRTLAELGIDAPHRD